MSLKRYKVITQTLCKTMRVSLRHMGKLQRFQTMDLKIVAILGLHT